MDAVVYGLTLGAKTSDMHPFEGTATNFLQAVRAGFDAVGVPQSAGVPAVPSQWIYPHGQSGAPSPYVGILLGGHAGTPGINAHRAA